jgi:hypothetical protein
MQVIADHGWRQIAIRRRGRQAAFVDNADEKIHRSEDVHYQYFLGSDARSCQFIKFPSSNT